MSNPSAAAAGTTRLGDREVNRLGYGAMRLAGPGVMGPPRDREEAIAVLRAAVELGVNHIDTSDYYGPFIVNDLIKKALHPYPDDLVLVTKVGAKRTPRGGWPAALSAKDLAEAIEGNLTRLGVDSIDVVNLRMADAGGGVFNSGSLAAPFEVLSELRQQGKIRHLGVSNVGLDQLSQAQDIAPVVCVQNAYNVVMQGDDEMVDSCAAQGIAYTPFFPLGGFSPLAADRFEKLAAEIDATTMQLAIAWLLARSPTILCIPGTSSVAHLRENIAAAEIKLTDEQMVELDGLEA